MAGLPPAYIARQLGHTSAEQLYKTYSHWIDGADRRVQRERLAAALISPEFPRVVGAEEDPAMKAYGRRDWTRTNDPHHVKVVL
jgi:integrase